MADKQTDYAIVPKLVGRYQEVRVTFINAPFLKPAGADQPRYAEDGFGPFIIEEIFDRQSILTKLKGVLSKKHLCRKCGADLTGKRTHKRRLAVEMKYKQLPAFKVELDMPAITCRECATNNAVNDKNTEYVVSGAIAEAFKNLKKHLHK
jgi:ribosomal protein L40E